jgi:hypothetical protein
MSSADTTGQMSLSFLLDIFNLAFD